MIEAVILDSTPLGLLAAPVRSAVVIAINKWLAALTSAGVEIILPEIADYEVRRELVRANKTDSVARLDVLKANTRYVPLTTDAMLLASELWARARQSGIPTADAKALDGDVILCAQVLTLGLTPDTFVVATANASHISRYLSAAEWSSIQP